MNLSSRVCSDDSVSLELNLFTMKACFLGFVMSASSYCNLDHIDTLHREKKVSIMFARVNKVEKIQLPSDFQLTIDANSNLELQTFKFEAKVCCNEDTDSTLYFHR